jgi:hypothetical protein
MTCSHCGSCYVIEEYDPRTHTILGYHCGMCGRTKFEEQAKDERLKEKGERQKEEGERRKVKGLNLVPCTLNLVPRPLPLVPCTLDRSPASDKGGSMSHRLCVVEGCTRIQVKDHRCQTHYREKHGVAPKERKKCTVAGCDKMAYRDHKCHAHYGQAAAEKNRKDRCQVPDCGKWAIAEGLCYRHLSQKYGGPDKNPYRDAYNSRKRKLARQGALSSAAAPPPSSPVIASEASQSQPLRSGESLLPFVYVFDTDEVLKRGDAVAMGEDGKLHRIILPTLEASSCHCEERSDVAISPFSVLSRLETITIEDINEPDDPAYLNRAADITFKYVNGLRPEFQFASAKNLQEPLTYGDWMFLGTIASEIKRISEEAL